jgi:hypothetical protein
MIVKLIVSVLVIEAVTEIFVASALFDRLRKWIGGEKQEGLDGKFGLKGVLVWCGYCVSVSVGIGVAYLLRVSYLSGLDSKLAWLAPFEPIVWGIALHRVSNLWHEALVRFLKRVPLTLFLQAWFTHQQSPGKVNEGEIEK